MDFLSDASRAAPAARRGRLVDFALGIMVVPARRALRDDIRATWLRPASRDAGVAAHFVAGQLSQCARTALAAEAALHGDVFFVNSSDCQPWFSAEKVHAWYLTALRLYPRARWFGKVEDDAMLRVSSVTADLRALSSLVDHDSPVYVGYMQWSAHCRQLERARGRGREWAATTCAQGCWLGDVAPSAGGRAPRCEKAFDGRSVVPGSAACPSLAAHPFAVGPLEVRSAGLARLVAHCACECSRPARHAQLAQ